MMFPTILVLFIFLLHKRCALDYGLTEQQYGELNWLECLTKISAILKVTLLKLLACLMLPALAKTSLCLCADIVLLQEPATESFNMQFLLDRTLAGNPKYVFLGKGAGVRIVIPVRPAILLCATETVPQSARICYNQVLC